MTATPTVPMYVVAIEHAGPHGDFVYEQKVRGDHPAVKAARAYFVLDGTPKDEWPSPLDRATEVNAAREAAEREERARQFAAVAAGNKVKLSVRVLRCTRDFVAYHNGQPATIQKGSEAVATDALVLEHPDNWR